MFGGFTCDFNCNLVVVNNYFKKYDNSEYRYLYFLLDL